MWARLRDEKLQGGGAVVRYRIGRDATICASRLGVTIRGPFDALRRDTALEVAALIALAGEQQARLEQGRAPLSDADERKRVTEALARAAREMEAEPGGDHAHEERPLRYCGEVRR